MEIHSVLRWFGKEKARTVRNCFHSDFPRRVLVSALDRPFIKGVHLKHNNLTESLEMAKVFHELGYQVDVVNYNYSGDLDYSQYEVVFGWGEPIESLFRRETTRLPLSVLYMAGVYGPVGNAASLRRLAEVHGRRGVWIPGSARIGGWGLGIESAVDALVVLGNGTTADTFRAATHKPIHSLPLFFLSRIDPAEILAARDLAEARRHFLWFSGSGLVHKGLDLALEAFRRHPELHLHVYGAIDKEAPFLRVFDQELNHSANIHVEGFLELQSPRFRAALLASAFVLSPSCSEGCNSSVLNICGNGGQVPILTRQCSIDLDDFGILVEDTTVEAVEAAILQASALSAAELERRTRSSAAFFQRTHSLDRYHQRLKEILQEILAI